MKLDWPHAVLLLGAMLFVAALTIMAVKFPQLGLAAVIIPAIGAIMAIVGAAFRGAQTAAVAADSSEKLAFLQARINREVDTVPPKTPKST